MLYLACDNMKRLQEFLEKYLLWIIAFIGLILFMIIVVRLKNNTIQSFDNYIYNYIKGLISPNTTNIFKVITEFGNVYIMIPVIILILIFSNDKSFKKYFIYNLISIFILNNILKLIFTRSRPLDINLIIETGYSFPSGHSMVSFAFYGFLAYFIYHTNLNRYLKILYILLLGLLVLLIGISRIYLGVHYASDVLGGFAISALYLVIFIKYIYNKNKEEKLNLK